MQAIRGEYARPGTGLLTTLVSAPYDCAGLSNAVHCDKGFDGGRMDRWREELRQCRPFRERLGALQLRSSDDARVVRSQ